MKTNIIFVIALFAVVEQDARRHASRVAGSTSGDFFLH